MSDGRRESDADRQSRPRSLDQALRDSKPASYGALRKLDKRVEALENTLLSLDFVGICLSREELDAMLKNRSEQEPEEPESSCGCGHG